MQTITVTIKPALTTCRVAKVYNTYCNASFSNTRQSNIITIDKCSLQQIKNHIYLIITFYHMQQKYPHYTRKIITSLQRTQLRIKIPTYLWQYLPASLFLQLVHKLMLLHAEKRFIQIIITWLNMATFN